MNAIEKSPVPPQGDHLKILVVEDTHSTAAAIQAALQAAGMDTVHADTGAAALALQQSFAPDIALVDLGLPDIDGLDLVTRFAAQAACGIIVIAADDDEPARLRSLEAGADDFVVKPIAYRELVARVRALHRRMRPHLAPTPDGIVLDHSRRQLHGPAGMTTPLTEAEYLALHALLDAAGAPVSRDDLSRAALRRTLHVEDRSVDQLVLKLRRKLGEHGASPRTILSVRGQGYVISDPGTVLAASTEG